MYSIEEVGLVKIDLLGNRCLTEIQETLEWVSGREPTWASHDRSFKKSSQSSSQSSSRTSSLSNLSPQASPLPSNFSLQAIPDHDEKTARLLETGETLGCFQLESPAMRQLLRQLRVQNVKDCIAAVALIRPGPAEGGMKEKYIRRSRGLEPIDFLHPSLKKVLEPNFGIILYEEDVMQVISVLTQKTLAEADELRSAIKKCKAPEELLELENDFVGKAITNGLPPSLALEAWNDLQRFASYCFNKAHASGYGLLAYQSAYLKAHYPVEFTCALLNHHAGMYSKRTLIEEARRLGVTILPPCVNHSSRTHRVENYSPSLHSTKNDVSKKPCIDNGCTEGDDAKGKSAKGRNVKGSGVEVHETEGDGVENGSVEGSNVEEKGAEKNQAKRIQARKNQAGNQAGNQEKAESSSHQDNQKDSNSRPVFSKAVRLALTQIKGLSRQSITRILKERPFASLNDLIRRTNIPRRELEALILVGALDFTGQLRPQLIWELETTHKSQRDRGELSLFTGLSPEDLQRDSSSSSKVPPSKAGSSKAPSSNTPSSNTTSSDAGSSKATSSGTSSSSPSPSEGALPAGDPLWNPEYPDLPDYTDLYRLVCELRYLDLNVSQHPFKVLLDLPDFQGRVFARAFSTLDPERRVQAGQFVRVAGLMAARRRTPTKTGQSMQFLTLEDETGLVEATLFPREYKRYAALLRGLGPFVAEGTVDDTYGSLTLSVKKLKKVNVETLSEQ